LDWEFASWHKERHDLNYQSYHRWMMKYQKTVEIACDVTISNKRKINRLIAQFPSHLGPQWCSGEFCGIMWCPKGWFWKTPFTILFTHRASLGTQLCSGEFCGILWCPKRRFWKTPFTTLFTHHCPIGASMVLWGVLWYSVVSQRVILESTLHYPIQSPPGHSWGRHTSTIGTPLTARRAHWFWDTTHPHWFTLQHPI
jgi:hypothetical protein